MLEALGVVTIRVLAVTDNSCLSMRSWKVFFGSFLFGLSEIFVNFGIKRGVRKLPKSFLSVKIGLPNNYGAAFVGRFDQRFDNN